MPNGSWILDGLNYSKIYEAIFNTIVKQRKYSLTIIKYIEPYQQIYEDTHRCLIYHCHICLQKHRMNESKWLCRNESLHVYISLLKHIFQIIR